MRGRSTKKCPLTGPTTAHGEVVEVAGLLLPNPRRGLTPKCLLKAAPTGLLEDGRRVASQT